MGRSGQRVGPAPIVGHVGRGEPTPMLWLLQAVIFTLDAVVLAVLGGPSAVVVLSAFTGLAAVVTFFITAQATANGR